MTRRATSRIALAVTALLVSAALAGCGSAAVTASPTAPPTSAPTASPSPTASPTATSSPAPSALASPSGSESPVPTLPVPHVDPSLEALLPATAGGITLEKWSWTLATYIDSSQGGDRNLYAKWLVPFGLTTDKVDMGIATDITKTENLVVEAIRVPGIDSGTLTTSFAKTARDDGWPVSSVTILGKPLVKITDPAADAAGSALSAAYIFAKGNVLYLIVTDDQQLLGEVVIKLA